jgi:plasmid maintenance system antidote protein VapI
MALRLGSFRGSGPVLRLHMQMGHDLWPLEHTMRADLARPDPSRAIRTS